MAPKALLYENQLVFVKRCVGVAKPRVCNRDATASVCGTRTAPRRTVLAARPSDQTPHGSSTISHKSIPKDAHVSIELMHAFKSVCECVQTQSRTKYTRILIKSRRGREAAKLHKQCSGSHHHACFWIDVATSRCGTPPHFKHVKKTNWFSYDCTFGAHPTGLPQRSNSWYRRVRARGQNYTKCSGILIKRIAPTCAPL